MIDKIAGLLIENRKVLFVRSKGQVLLYTTGGKRKPGESDIEALLREHSEELGIRIIPESIRYANTFLGVADGRIEDGVIVDLQLTGYLAHYQGVLTPQNEIEEMAWLTSTDGSRTTPTGQAVLAWLHQKGFID